MSPDMSEFTGNVDMTVVNSKGRRIAYSQQGVSIGSGGVKAKVDAQKNEPNNASLYYVEGNARAKLGQNEEALAAYDKAIEVNPNYEWGYIGKGMHLYNMAVEVSKKADEEYNDAKYQALLGEFEQYLKGCVPPFEKAFEMVSDPEIKKSIAEYLKQACFRFRTDPEYQAKHEKYSAVADAE